jgi:glycosyltransferase involved in cell wall biosynthesis
VKHVCIGIHVYTEPERLHATLASLQANTSQPVELLLLLDGPDEMTNTALAAHRDLPQSCTAEPLGPPACFNRLAVSTDVSVLVLLESGALVGPGWLDFLLAALDADPRNGLAGPSTNYSWNEQAVFPHSGGTRAEVACTAQEAARCFGLTTRTLEPLHSLADFCYVVRREVVQAIGAADESYGLGPCWEMDYNIRAARAGFRAVWAGAAYVHRAPFTARRWHQEVLRFEASKHRYQDKFCALRLRRQRTDYERHCRGEDCEHFAPPSLIQIHLPTPAIAPPVVLAPAISPISPPTDTPLVSCIMPTGNRTAFVRQSIRYFQRQDYPARELVIVDDGSEELAGQLPEDPRIRYVRLPPGQSIGTKRNKACEMARGSIIAHWDDDDWYTPGRLSAQVAPLLSGEADISGLTASVFFDLPRWEFWSCTPDLHCRLFVEDAHGGTLVYQRRVWEQLAHYPHTSLGEDAIFLRQAIRRGARLCRLSNNGLFIYLRHARNSWSFTCGQYLNPQGWQRVAEPLLPPEDRAFYAAHSSAAPIAWPDSSPLPLGPAQPLVSCIMPTADRRVFVPQAIQCFLQQDYANRELIVVDDGIDVVADLIPPGPRIRYVRLEGKHTIGAKRNLACQEAKGEIIVHWDDDDWMANWRLSYQVASLLKEQADLCGLDKVLYYDPRSGQAWQYIYPKGRRPWVAGNTLCYTKAFWQGNPFPDMNVGEDTRFLWSNHPKNMLTLQDVAFYIALIHPGNTSPKQLQDGCWHSYPIAEVRKLMGGDWTFYADLLQCR